MSATTRALRDRLEKPVEQCQAYFMALFSDKDYSKVLDSIAKVDKVLRATAPSASNSVSSATRSSFKNTRLIYNFFLEFLATPLRSVLRSVGVQLGAGFFLISAGGRFFPYIAVYRSDCLTLHQKTLLGDPRAYYVQFQCWRRISTGILQHPYAWHHRPSLTTRNLTPAGVFASNIPATKWTKHGQTALLVPGHDPPIDIKIYMDVHPQPGPTNGENTAVISIGRLTKTTMHFPLL